MKVIVLKLENQEEENKFNEFFETFTSRKNGNEEVRECSLKKSSPKVRCAKTHIYMQTGKSRYWNVTNILNMIGIKANLKGYGYIREIVVKSLEDERFFDFGITKNIYPYVAKTFSTSPEKVERSIRHAIETAWFKGNNEIFEKMFPCCSERPTNSEFLAKIVDEIRLLEKEQK